MNKLKYFYIQKYNFSIYNEYINAYRKKINRIPFYIRRTASDNLPVFLKHKNNKNLVVTVIRKIKGNKDILKKEIETICNQEVISKPDCFLIKGNHKKKIKEYFKYIGY